MSSEFTDLPKAEEIPHFFLACVVSNVLHLRFTELMPRAPGADRGSVRELQWTTCCVGVT